MDILNLHKKVGSNQDNHALYITSNISMTNLFI